MKRNNKVISRPFGSLYNFATLQITGNFRYLSFSPRTSHGLEIRTKKSLAQFVWVKFRIIQRLFHCKYPTKCMNNNSLVLDAGAGRNFKRKDVQHAFLNNQSKPENPPDIQDTNKHQLKLLGTINLAVQLAYCQVQMNFFVCDSLAATKILFVLFLYTLSDLVRKKMNKRSEE